MRMRLHYFLDCPLPREGNDNLERLLQAQADVVADLLLEGSLLQYALSTEKGRWWAVISALTEWEARCLAARLPLSRDAELEISPLRHFACNETLGFSLN